MEQQGTEVREYKMPEFLLKYNPQELVEEKWIYQPSFFGQTKKKTPMTPEQKLHAAANHKQHVFRRKLST